MSTWPGETHAAGPAGPRVAHSPSHHVTYGPRGIHFLARGAWLVSYKPAGDLSLHCAHDNGGTGGTREVPYMLRTYLTDILTGGELKRPLRSTRGASSLVMQRGLST
jgi:hypothetical protein